MRKIKKEFETEFLIFKTFLKHVKMAHMYPQFRGSVNMMDREKDLFYVLRKSFDKSYYNDLQRLGNIHSTYMGCKNVENLLETMRHSNGGILNVEYTAECQMKVMNTVNGLIHSCLEYAIHDDFKILEKIGGDVFNEVCTLLFGEGFVDKTNEIINPNNDKQISEMLKKMIPPEMLRGRGDRDPKRDKAFMEWLKMMQSQRMGIDMETEGMPQNKIWQTPPPPPNGNGWYTPYGIGDWEYDVDDDWNS